MQLQRRSLTRCGYIFCTNKNVLTNGNRTEFCCVSCLRICCNVSSGVFCVNLAKFRFYEFCACTLRSSSKNDNLCAGSRISSRSEEHTSELQSLMRTSYAVFCSNKQKKR